MDRFRDYVGFSIQFVGLGYIALWPLSTADGSRLFGAPFVCTGGLLQVVCNWPHPLTFGFGLHAAGALCTLLALPTLGIRVVARARKKGGRAATPARPSRPAVVALAPKPPRHPVPPPRKIVEPRTHFGLRGLPH